MNLGSILIDTGRLWWKHWIGILVLNILWFLLQIPIITGPPATAAFFAIGRRLVDEEMWEFPELWQAFRTHFWQGWLWALPNLLLYIVIGVNFLAYQNDGVAWIALRFFWIFMLVGWLTMNLFYWPFWFKADTPYWGQTVSNCWKLLLMHPAPAIGLLFLVLASTALGGVLVLPIPFGLVGLFVLATTLFTDHVVSKSNNSAVDGPN